MQSVLIAQKMFLEIDKLLWIYLTIPVTTTTAERSFSALHQNKIYLRSTMTEERLNNIMLLHVHKDICDTLDLKKIAQCFVSCNFRRQGYFGNFSLLTFLLCFFMYIRRGLLTIASLRWSICRFCTLCCQHAI